MNRRAFVMTMTGAVGAAGATAVAGPAWLPGPIGSWDSPVRFEHVGYITKGGKLDIYFVGWRAEYHGREYGMRYPVPEDCTLEKMATLVALLQNHADEVLTGLIQSGGAR